MTKRNNLKVTEFLNSRRYMTESVPHTDMLYSNYCDIWVMYITEYSDLRTKNIKTAEEI